MKALYACLIVCVLLTGCGEPPQTKVENALGTNPCAANHADIHCRNPFRPMGTLGGQ